ncbi:hypothetical protein ACWD5R_03905 [Streptomyces sp. NPDC002514]|uniref:hypothetical protein n=1 Tax=Streptomyces sp. NPDC001270 TaxID=3364554 RepID=UPI0036908331
MLRIIDARTGRPVHAAPARRGLTRVEAHASGSDTSDLRVLLVADLLSRALELGGTPVWSLLTGGHREAELRAAATALGIRPFEEGHGLAAGLGEAQVVHVVAADGALPTSGVVVGVAPALGTDSARKVPPAHGADEAGAAPPDRDAEPAVLRLALLATRRDAPVRVDPGALDRAGRTLAHWRRAVARWARQPSRPIPDEVRGRLRAAWEDNLDVTEVLNVLNTVAEVADVPDGARFETYAYADRLLGLDLVRDIGSPA